MKSCIGSLIYQSRTSFKHDCPSARADHKTLLQLEKEVDILVARFKAEMPVEECKALLAELAVRDPSCCSVPPSILIALCTRAAKQPTLHG